MKKVTKVLIILIILGLVFFAVDYTKVKNQEKPIFCIPLGVIQDGGTREYLGLGYKVIDFHKIESILDDSTIEIKENSVIDINKKFDYYDRVHIGSWFMIYDSALRQRNNGGTVIQIKEIEFVRTYTVLKNTKETDRKYNYYAIEENYWDTPIVIKIEKEYDLEENTVYEFTFKGMTSDGARYSTKEIFDNFKVINTKMIDKIDTYEWENT